MNRALQMLRHQKSQLILCIAAAIVSALLLAVSYPPMDQHVAAWTALVPLIIAARFSTPRRSFRLGFVAGYLFWSLNLSWLLAIARTGAPMALALASWLLLSSYCALYMAVFASVISRWFRRWQTNTPGPAITILFAVPTLWVGLEYIRSVACTGFPWNTLAISQAANLPFCQLAALGGVYAVSWLVMVMNTGVAMTILNFRGTPLGRRYRTHPELMIALTLWALALAYGLRQMTTVPQDNDLLCVTTVQPNIEQRKKWPPEWMSDTRHTLDMLTRDSIDTGVDMVIWPETATPRYAIAGADRRLIDALLTETAPLLVGSMHEGNHGESYNASILFQTAAPEQVYRKQHLIPFGEYVPLRHLLPALDHLAPLGWSCDRGNEAVVFRLQDRPSALFSVLICFEDVFPEIARDFVLKGARLLVNQTNDAWFDGSAAAAQHLAHCRFRCIENRVSCVRSANTGISCFIDQTGYISPAEVIQGADREYRIADHLTSEVALRPVSAHLSVYTQYGYIFGILSGIAAIIAVFHATIPPLRGQRKIGNFRA